MPHKLPVGKAVTTGSDIISQRPELAQMIGRITNEWNYVEKHMEWLYAGLMGKLYLMPFIPAMAAGSISAHPIAHQIFEELESFRARRNLFEALLKWALTDCPEQFKVYEAVVKNPLKNAYASRNAVAHTLWGICPDYPDALISQPTFGHSLVWRRNDFLEELKKVSQGLAVFQQATAKVREFVSGHRASPC